MVCAFKKLLTEWGRHASWRSLLHKFFIANWAQSFTSSVGIEATSIFAHDWAVLLDIWITRIHLALFSGLIALEKNNEKWKIYCPIYLNITNHIPTISFPWGGSHNIRSGLTSIIWGIQKQKHCQPQLAVEKLLQTAAVTAGGVGESRHNSCCLSQLLALVWLLTGLVSASLLPGGWWLQQNNKDQPCQPAEQLVLPSVTTLQLLLHKSKPWMPWSSSLFLLTRHLCHFKC